MNLVVRNPMVLWNSLLGVSLGALLVTAAVHHFMPFLEEGKSEFARNAERTELEKARLAKTAEFEAARSVISTYTWKGEDDQVEAQVLELVNKLARQEEVRINAFRTQKSVAEGAYSRRPFVLSLDAPYPKIIGFLRKLETPSNRLAVNLVQFGSADGWSDLVSATVGIIAYQESASKPPPSVQPSQSKSAALAVRG